MVADLALVGGDDAFQDRALGPCAARDQNLFVDGGRSGNHMGLLLQAREQCLPVADAVAFDTQQIDVRGGTEQPVLQVLTKSVVDGQRDDERSHASRHSNDGDDGDDADDSLSPLGPQVARGYEEFELHSGKTQRKLIVSK